MERKATFSPALSKLDIRGESNAIKKPVRISAIETRYNGYRFRSRLEARWAVFFDKAGIEYDYEPQGFDLGELGPYLPDFYLPQHETWFEVKGKPATQKERQKCMKLCLGTGNTVLLGVGTIGPAKTLTAWNLENTIVFKWKTKWARCSGCNRNCLSIAPTKSPCNCSRSKADPNHPNIREAYLAARQARFGH